MCWKANQRYSTFQVSLETEEPTKENAISTKTLHEGKEPQRWIQQRCLLSFKVFVRKKQAARGKLEWRNKRLSSIFISFCVCVFSFFFVFFFFFLPLVTVDLISRKYKAVLIFFFCSHLWLPCFQLSLSNIILIFSGF